MCAAHDERRGGGGGGGGGRRGPAAGSKLYLGGSRYIAWLMQKTLLNLALLQQGMYVRHHHCDHMFIEQRGLTQKTAACMAHFAAICSLKADLGWWPAAHLTHRRSALALRHGRPSGHQRQASGRPVPGYDLCHAQACPPSPGVHANFHAQSASSSPCGMHTILLPT